MERLFHFGTAVVALFAAVTFATGSSAAGYSADQDVGSSGLDNMYERVIAISPNARWVNVNREETIKFIDASSGKSFVWYFKTPAMRFDLAKVAPAGILSGRRVDVYIGPSQRELNQNSGSTRAR